VLSRPQTAWSGTSRPGLIVREALDLTIRLRLIGFVRFSAICHSTTSTTYPPVYHQKRVETRRFAPVCNCQQSR